MYIFVHSQKQYILHFQLLPYQPITDYIYKILYFIQNDLQVNIYIYIYIYILNKIIIVFGPHLSWAEPKDLRLFLYTQKAYFSQILFKNLSKSVLVSTSPLPR